MTTKLWAINEHPGYTIEQTPGAWVLWGPCGCEGATPLLPNVDCPYCGGTGDKVIKTHPSAVVIGVAITEELSIDHWELHQIQ